MATELYLLAVLFALLLGLMVGKAWERYKLRDGRWIDRRRLRETPHYMLGLNFLVDNQVDQAIEELTHATSTDTDALEIQMILGNLYREKGQVGRAVNVHQALLTRPDLTKLEHAYVLLCLGLDFRHGGFVDRALEAFQEVLQLDPQNRYALVNLQKLYEDQHQWGEALRVREQIAKIDAGRHPDDQPILGFLRNEIGSAQQRAGDVAGAARTFADAIDVDGRTVPAYLNLGDVRQRQGNLPGAVEVWERLIDAVPDHAYFAFDRLERAYRTLGTPRRFVDLCERLIDRDPQGWRPRLALSRHLVAAGQHRAAFDRLLDAVPYHPHGLAIHQEIWETLAALEFDAALIRRYVELTREAVFYLDPHICRRCRYRSTELLWQCPQCREWNTFV
ncbi:MAG: tetratricopeptide repeat protein, partial [Acidobacteria bacterium]|nr:tetratricopeptide repeat protein [Acidobacteriota bacterium]